MQGVVLVDVFHILQYSKLHLELKTGPQTSQVFSLYSPLQKCNNNDIKVFLILLGTTTGIPTGTFNISSFNETVHSKNKEKVTKIPLKPH